MSRKRIVCFGDSNTWGYNGKAGGARFEDEARWTQVMAALLGSEYQVVEEGLNGRTTIYDFPLKGQKLRNGLAALPVVLATHMPMDLLILMLGTNDCKERIHAEPEEITAGLERLIRTAVSSSDVWRTEPKVLVVAPMVIKTGIYQSFAAREMGAGCAEKSQALPALMEDCARRNGCAFLDCNEVCTPNHVDYVHFDAESHQRFGRLIAEKVRAILV